MVRLVSISCENGSSATRLSCGSAGPLQNNAVGIQGNVKQPRKSTRSTCTVQQAQQQSSDEVFAASVSQICPTFGMAGGTCWRKLENDNFPDGLATAPCAILHLTLCGGWARSRYSGRAQAAGCKLHTL